MNKCSAFKKTKVRFFSKQKNLRYTEIGTRLNQRSQSRFCNFIIGENFFYTGISVCERVLAYWGIDYNVNIAILKRKMVVGEFWNFLKLRWGGTSVEMLVYILIVAARNKKVSIGDVVVILNCARSILSSMNGPLQCDHFQWSSF